MATVDVYNMEGAVVGQMELADGIFGIEPHETVLHMAVVNQLANRRQGTHSTKTRSEVRGGGRKPYRQKGTDRARQGSIRAAQWIKGGIIFGPTPRDYGYTLPKKVRRLAMKSALSSKLKDGSLTVLDALRFERIRTKSMVKVLADLKVEGSALLVLPGPDETVQRSARNIPGIKTVSVNNLNVLDILKFDRFIVTREAVEKVQEVYV